MIPDRSTFNTWDVAGLSGAGGEVENSVKRMKKAADDARDALSELNWEGAAAGAASSVFGDLFVESVIWESFGEDISREIRSGARRLESAAPKIKFLVGGDREWPPVRGQPVGRHAPPGSHVAQLGQDHGADCGELPEPVESPRQGAG
ncbi:hypothetical protein [Gordonia paraffinivorans]|uniref:hypothetical protein n=1 Tax=Gordonia paraffinivorans TaxID=175628 RepID=UPI00144724EF|nr:hypothetical protein [Gordonia paraffinivorans]